MFPVTPRTEPDLSKLTFILTDDCKQLKPSLGFTAEAVLHLLPLIHEGVFSHTLSFVKWSPFSCSSSKRTRKLLLHLMFFLIVTVGTFHHHKPEDSWWVYVND